MRTSLLGLFVGARICPHACRPLCILCPVPGHQCGQAVNPGVGMATDLEPLPVMREVRARLVVACRESASVVRRDHPSGSAEVLVRRWLADLRESTEDSPALSIMSRIDDVQEVRVRHGGWPSPACSEHKVPVAGEVPAAQAASLQLARRLTRPLMAHSR